MKVIVKIVIVVTLLLITKVNAQEFQGEATYKSKSKVDIKLDSTHIASGMAEQMKEMLKKQFEKTYILNFNKVESTYKEEEALAPPNPQGMDIMMVMSGGSDVLYKNFKDKRYVNQNESFSKLFLIKDELKDIEWTLESETKNIGEYTCFKATTIREVPDIKSSISFNGDNDLSTGDEEPKMKEIIITAWYTPQIAVSAGPGKYHGLPGLILEVNNGSETVICSKIVINPHNVSQIIEPDNGKVVTQEAYDSIMEKKLKDMQEHFKSNNRGRDGETIEIRIGG